MEAFFTIAFIMWLVRKYLRNLHQNYVPKLKDDRIIEDNPIEDNPVVDKTEEEVRRQKDIEYLRKQGYAEDLIAMIIPVIND